MGKNFLLPITYYPKRPSVVPPTRKKRVGFPTIFCDFEDKSIYSSSAIPDLLLPFSWEV
jgi:hypothetical protein